VILSKAISRRYAHAGILFKGLQWPGSNSYLVGLRGSYRRIMMAWSNEAAMPPSRTACDAQPAVVAKCSLWSIRSELYLPHLAQLKALWNWNALIMDSWT